MAPSFPARSRPWVVAHRGSSAEAPENTASAFHLAWEQGADAIEGDFHLTADGVVVCHHDAATGRIFLPRRKIAATSWEVLRALRLRRREASAGDVHIPSLREFLEWIPAGRGAFIELKGGPAMVDAVRRTLTEAGVDPAALVLLAFEAETIREVRRQLPDWQASWLVHLGRGAGRVLPAAPTLAEGARALGVAAVGLSAHPAIDPELVAGLHRHGLAVHVWTVDDAAEARRLAAAGVDSITSNRPAAIRQALGRRGTS